jgi:Fic family protein
MLPLAKLSPYSLDTPELLDKERELVRLAGSLESALHPAAAQALAKSMAGINSYYSNLIEGPSTHPITAELAATGSLPAKEGEVVGKKTEDLRQQALAGIAATFDMRRKLETSPSVSLASADFIRFLHFSFTSRLPDSLREVKDADGNIAVVIPGEFRNRHVAVGDHVAPDPKDIPDLISAFEEMYRIGGASSRNAMLMHHRLAWIHPFLDGNGRTARQLTDAMLIRSGAGGGGLWSLSRGLAKRKSDYLTELRAADADRKGPYDGRGERSNAASERFVHFMLDVAIDQVAFMADRLSTDHLMARLQRFCEERTLVLDRDPRAFVLLKEAFLVGPYERGKVAEMLHLSTRRSSDLIKELLHDRLLSSPSDKGPLRAAFPMYSLAYLFPHMFPIDNPEVAMKAFCNRENTPPLASEIADQKMPKRVMKEGLQMPEINWVN